MATEKIDLLFKKNLGVPFAFPNEPYTAEYGSSARKYIVADKQLYADSIPGVAPNDVVQDTTFNSLYGKRYRKPNSAYSHIVKYEKIVLTSLSPLRSYYFKPTATVTENILQHTIPFNYDPGASYRVIVYINDTETAENDGNYPWVFDGDAGVLTFISTNQLPAGSTVKITFWRYEGRFGFPGAPTFLLDGGRPNTDFSKAGGYDSGRI